VSDRTSGRKLLVVEDDPFTGALLSGVLESHGFEVRVEKSAIDAKEAMKKFDADGALLDIQLGDGPSGVALAQVFHELYPYCALALLTRFPDPHAAGLVKQDLPPDCGFLRKDLISDSEYLLAALEEILTDRGFKHRDDKKSDRPFSKLTNTQMEVLKMVSEGFTNAAIARKRNTTESAVEQTLSAINKSLGIPIGTDINPRTEMARRYIQVAGVPER
jgi:DNA-binding NarL/FixJ family response regulator